MRIPEITSRSYKNTSTTIRASCVLIFRSTRPSVPINTSYESFLQTISDSVFIGTEGLVDLINQNTACSYGGRCIFVR